jgi:hypothetical protein
MTEIIALFFENWVIGNYLGFGYWNLEFEF